MGHSKGNRRTALKEGKTVCLHPCNRAAVTHLLPPIGYYHTWNQLRFLPYPSLCACNTVQGSQ